MRIVANVFAAGPPVRWACGIDSKMEGKTRVDMFVSAPSGPGVRGTVDPDGDR